MNSTSNAVRVLILSKDPTLLSNQTGFGDTLQRHVFYGERLAERSPGSELRIVTYSRKQSDTQFLNPSPNLRIYGTASGHRAMFLLDALLALRKVFAGGWKPTVITTQEPYEDGQLGLWLARRYGARFIPQLHFDLFSGDWLKESRLNPLRRFIARRVLRQADAVRVVSQEQKRKLISKINLSANTIHIVPVGVSFKPTANEKEHCKAVLHPDLAGHQVVLFVGRLTPQKNMGLWLDVVAKIQRYKPETRFVIAGDGPLMAELQAAACRKGLESSLLFLGNVPYENLPMIYGAADVFLLTSHYEGFGRVIVEASMAALPSIATACTGPEDIIVNGETGNLCNTGDGQCLSVHLLNLLNDTKMLARFGQAARRHVDQLFGREHLADSLVNMWTAQ